MSAVCCCLESYARYIAKSCDDFWYMTSISSLFSTGLERKEIKWMAMHMLLQVPGHLGHVC